MKIRRMMKEEFDTVLALLNESRETDYSDLEAGVFAFTPSDFVDAVSGADVTLVADEDGKIVGTISVSKIKPGVYSAGSLVVSKGYRGRGIGAGLLEGALVQSGGASLVVALPNEHTAAAHVFEQAGYKKVGIVMERE